MLRGETAEHVKPFKGVGSGVMEIAERYATNAYRLVYAVQLGNSLYVLHVFQKKLKSGVETPQMDVDLIVKRYKEARERAKNAIGIRITISGSSGGDAQPYQEKAVRLEIEQVSE